uniref:Tubulin-specific chaperone A n=1 Tax=Syphacia muris TaxID=451379 RepID=A0A0N5AJD4_9BILA
MVEVPVLPSDDQEQGLTAAYGNYLKSAKSTVAQIKRAVEQLKEQDEQWTDLLLWSEDTKYEEEQALYDEVVENPEGMFRVMEKADEAVLQLETNIREVERLMKNNRRINESNETRNVEQPFMMMKEESQEKDSTKQNGVIVYN